MAAGAWATEVAAQPAAPADDATTVEEVYVTGSLIAGTPENAAVPVDVIGQAALEAQGSPTVVQLVRNLTAVGSGIGESNRYNGGAGSATINLRGFGAARTLSLLNGRRMADTTQAAFQGGGADLDFIPTAAIGRIEILKDGAAATYGSDAVGGVVNFITRTNLDGLEVSAEYAAVRGSGGDYNANIAWGHVFDRGNILLTAGYRRRSVLSTLDRDWAIQPYANNTFAGWTATTSVPNYLRPNGTAFPAGNYLGPDGVLYNLATGGSIRDNGCAELGGQLLTGAAPVTPATATAASTCRFQFTPFNDLVNDEYHYQTFGQINFDITDNMRFHTDFFWSKHDVPRQRISPSNGTTNFPTAASLGGTSGSTGTPSLNGQTFFFVPNRNPGLQATFNFVTNPALGCQAPLTRAQCAAALSGTGLSLPQAGWRPIAFSGDPNNETGGGFQRVVADAYRISSGFSGRLWGAVNWDTAVTYMSSTSNVNTPDMLVNRIQNALNGFGSRQGDANQCTVAEMADINNAGNAAAGCYYFNPFANAQTNFLAGGTGTQYSNAAVANDPAVLRNLYVSPRTTITNRLLVWDGVVNGDLPFRLPGGNIAAALGAQVRHNTYLGDYSALNNSEITPCVDSIDDGTPVCPIPTGALIFNASLANYNYSGDVWAVFGEIQFPILENLQVTGAVRHEEYGGNIGSTTNPKVAIRWQPLEWLTIRGSASTTFRAPTPLTTTPREAKGVSNYGGSYRGIITANNPNLVPETANTYNIGFIFEHSGFAASIDYYRFDFENELTLETTSQIYALSCLLQVGGTCPAGSTAPGGPTGPGSFCADPAYASLRSRFTYSANGAAACDSREIIQTRINNVNGPSTQTSGIDVRLSYQRNVSWGFIDSVQAGLEGTYLIEYARGEFRLLGAPDTLPVLAGAVDRAGTYDLISAFYSYPRIRGNAFLTVGGEGWSARWQMMYQQGVQPVVGAAGAASGVIVGGVTQGAGRSDDYWQHDVVLRWTAPWRTEFTLSVQNVFDTDPPFAISQYNYDYTGASPLGRVVEIGLRHQF